MATFKRFWCLRGEVPDLTHEGYLRDPEDRRYSAFYKSNAQPFDAIKHVPCLILLGEPGSRKSFAVDEMKKEIEAGAIETADKVLAINLKEVGSGTFKTEIEKADEFVEWMKGNGVLHLILDSFDECLIRVENLSALVAGLLERIGKARSRLRLRIACRPADWPTQLEGKLKKLWSEKDECGAYTLLPLRLEDVRAEAADSAVDIEGFIQAVAKANAVPFAIKPLTLRFLIEEFESKKGLSGSQEKLYERGCLRLCAEGDESRQHRRRWAVLTREQRLAVASRIAAVMILCKKTMVSVEAEQHGDEDTVSILSLARGQESISGDHLDVSEGAVRDTLDTALFGPKGPGKFVFAHQTYAEYLAARYIATHELKPEQVQSLIFHQDVKPLTVVPQLVETVGWLVRLDKATLETVLTNDSLALLRSDVATADDAGKKAMVGLLLKKMDACETTEDGWSLAAHLARFAHPGLAEQLRPYIADKSRDVVARRTAIDIAEANKQRSLLDLLVLVALDDEENTSVRVTAIKAIGTFGDDEHCRPLIPLLGQDSEGRVVINVVHVLTSRRIVDIVEMLKSLDRFNQKDFGGYDYLLLSQEWDGLWSREEVAKILEWLTGKEEECDFHKDWNWNGRFTEKLVSLALKHLSMATVREALAGYARHQLKSYRGIFSQHDERAAFLKNYSERRELIRAIVVDAGADQDLSGLAWPESQLISGEDFEWLINEAINAGDEIIARCFAGLAEAVVNRGSVEHFECMLTACEYSPIIRDAFKHHLMPIRIDSEAVSRWKDQREKWKELERRQERKPVNPPMPEQIKQILCDCERGQIDGYERLSSALILDPSGRADKGRVEETDIRKLDGWINADDETRKRIIQASENYLLSVTPNDDYWLLGYQAFVLLYHVKKAALEFFSQEVWDKWAMTILACPDWVGAIAEDDADDDLIGLAYKNSRVRVTQGIEKVVIRQDANKNSSQLPILNRLSKCWDEDLFCALLKMVDGNLRPSSIADILNALLERDFVEAEKKAKAFLVAPLPVNERERELASSCASLLLSAKSGGGWRMVKTAVMSDRKFGRDVFENLPRVNRQEGYFLWDMPEVDLIEIYLWLEKEYPSSEDPEYGSPDRPMGMSNAIDLRNYALNVLVEKGTLAGVRAIKKIMTEFPTLTWLKYTLARAQKRMFRETWRPAEVKDFLALCASPASRLVRSAAELRAVLMEALQEINQGLQGETPSAPDVWNHLSDGRRRVVAEPKDENQFTDWVKRQLERSLALRGLGILAAREVQIRRGERAAGENTDLYVTARVKGVNGDDEVVCVIVEVKGCWHAELKTAMKTQLVDRYLRDNHCVDGIYLVGWFACEAWSDSDRRKAKTPGLTAREALEFFKSQAARLSEKDVTVEGCVLNAGLR